MENHYKGLHQLLSEQIALEEELSFKIREQLAEINETDFVEVTRLLKQTYDTLERHYAPLNNLLDKLDGVAKLAREETITSNGVGLDIKPESEPKIPKISRMLREDYSALSNITFSNAQLHTIALALESRDTADLALEHLKNLMPLVFQVEELVPEVIMRELMAESLKVDISVAEIAQNNTRLAWNRVKGR
jgi:hypothetical protein